MDHTLTAADLRQFTGTDRWFRHSLVRRVTYTEGVQYMAEHGGAYWLIDEVATNQLHRKVAEQPFQVWTLVVRPNNTATLRCEDGDYNVVFKKEIEYTDFPLPSIVLWFTDNVIMLPSEY
jgi:hypothetical protein